MCTITTTTLRDKAMLVSLRRNQFNPAKLDKTATGVAEAALQAKGAGRYTKRLLKNCDQLKAAQEKYRLIYEYFRDNSLPWMNDGVRIIPTKSYFDFMTTIGTMKSEAEAAVQALYNVWDQAVADDAKCLGGMFNISDYPTKDEMLNAWGVHLTVMPVPSSEDFRVDISEEDKADLDAAVKEVEEQATVEVLTQLLKPIKAMADKLAVPIGQEGSVFRETLVNNITDVCRRAKNLNINNDKRIDEIIAEAEAALRGVDSQTLRECEIVRSATAKTMDELADKLDQWL